MSWDRMAEPDWDENMRVVHRGRGSELVSMEAPQRSKAESMRDGILDETTAYLEAARASITEALELFSLLTTPRHPNLGLLVSQQLEQVAEFRRAKQ